MRLIPPKELKPIDWEATNTSFGVLSLLYCLNTLMEDEFYEECAKIRDVIDSGDQDLKKFEEEAFEIVQDYWVSMEDKPVTRNTLERTYGLYATDILIKLGYKPDEPYTVTMKSSSFSNDIVLN